MPKHQDELASMEVEGQSGAGWSRDNDLQGARCSAGQYRIRPWPGRRQDMLRGPRSRGGQPTPRAKVERAGPGKNVALMRRSRSASGDEAAF